MTARSRRRRPEPLMALGVAIFATGGALDLAHHVLGGAAMLPVVADEAIGHAVTLVGMLLIVAGLIAAAIGSRTRRPRATGGAGADRR